MCVGNNKNLIRANCMIVCACACAVVETICASVDGACGHAGLVLNDRERKPRWARFAWSWRCRSQAAPAAGARRRRLYARDSGVYNIIIILHIHLSCRRGGPACAASCACNNNINVYIIYATTDRRQMQDDILYFVRVSVSSYLLWDRNDSFRVFPPLAL